MFSRQAGAIVLAVLAGCRSTPLVGTVDKGPYVLGSTVAVSTLDGDGAPTGKVFLTQTHSDRGEFGVDLQNVQGFVAVEGAGFYFDEVTGELSAAPLTLRAFTAVGTTPVHVNPFTHLATLRVRELASGGADLDDAITQAEEELVTALGIGPPGFALDQRGTDLDPTGDDTDDNAYILATSAILLATAHAERPDAPDAALQELMNTIALDVSADGALDPSIRDRLEDGESAVDVAGVMEHLSQRLASLGMDPTVADIGRMVDGDHDGAVYNDDCDDGAPDVHPGAQEICDGADTDEDCDDVADDDDPSVDPGTGMLFYEDLDGDGFGGMTTSTRCDASSTWSAENGDCDDANPRAWAACATCGDGDADGWWAGCDAYPAGDGPDCDDGDDALYPGAPELCDGLHDDCSGWIGDTPNLPADEVDDDDDGFVECHPQPGPWGNVEAVPVVGGDDCDDAHDWVHPGAAERCDGVFDDCADRGGPATAPADETDDDGDDYVECILVGPWLGPADLEGGDCDDTDTSVSPAAAESFYDGIDQDCDGLSDYDADADGFDSDQYGGDDCDDTDPTFSPGAPELCDGVDNRCDPAWTPAYEDGMVSRGSEDVTDAFAGAPGDPAVVLLTGGQYTLCAGTYYARMEASTPVSTSLTSIAGAEATIVDADTLGVVLEVSGGATVSVTGLTLQNGKKTTVLGGGASVEADSTLNIHDSIVTGNVGLSGAGIAVWDGTLLAIGTTISDNRATDQGGGVSVGGPDASATFDGVTFSGNLAASRASGLSVSQEASAIVKSSSLVGNGSSSGLVFGVAINCSNTCDVTVEDSLISQNTGGPAVTVSPDGRVELVDTVLSDNPDVTLWMSGGEIDLVRSTVEGGQGTTAVHMQSTAALSCTDGAIVDSDVSFAAVVIRGLDATVDATACDLGEADDDNSPVDILMWESGVTYDYGNDATFSCSNATCSP